MAIDTAKIRSIMEQKLASAQSLQTEWEGKNEVMPPEVQNQVTALLGEFDAYKAQLDLATKTA